MILAFWGFAGRKSRAILMEMNVGINNIQYISYGMHKEVKFGMIICHYLVNSFGYSMMPYDLDCNFQFSGILHRP